MGLEGGGADCGASGSLSPPSRVSAARVGSGFGERGAPCWGGEGRAHCRLSHLWRQVPREAPGGQGRRFTQKMKIIQHMTPYLPVNGWMA